MDEDGRGVDIGARAAIQVARLERRDRVAHRIAQPEAVGDPGVRQLAAFDAGVAAGGDDHALRVEQQHVRIDGVQAVDVRERLARGGGVHRREHGRGRPPAAVVGALVEVAIEHVHRQASQEAGLAEQAGRHGGQQLRRRALEHVLGLAAGDGDLLQQRTGECVGLGGLVDAAVPHHAVEAALDLAGTHGHVEQARREDVLAGEVDPQRVLRVVAERQLHRRQRHGRPARPRIALVRLAAALRREVRDAAQAHGRGAGTQAQPVPGRQARGVVGHHDAAVAVDERQHLVVRREPLEDHGRLALEVEHQRQHADRAAALLDAPCVGQGPLAVAEVGGLVALDMAALATQRALDDGRRRTAGEAVDQARQHAAVGREQHDVAIDRVARGIGAQALAQGREHRRVVGDTGVDDGRIGREEADVGGALEQVAREHVHRDLRLVAQRVVGQREHLLGQADEQLARELAEARAHLAHVGLEVGQVGEQRQRVPRAAERGERLAMVVDGMHVARERRHVVGEGDAFVRRHGVGVGCGRPRSSWG